MINIHEMRLLMVSANLSSPSDIVIMFTALRYVSRNRTCLTSVYGVIDKYSVALSKRSEEETELLNSHARLSAFPIPYPYQQGELGRKGRHQKSSP